MAFMVIIRRIVTYKIFINKQLNIQCYNKAGTVYILVFQFIKLGLGRAMLASDVGIEMLAILSHEDGIRSIGPLSSEDVAVVVDFHWFTDCHLEAIFYMNSSRLDLRPPLTGKIFV